MLNEAGFVKVDDHLRVLGHPNVFVVGDIAASDPNRSSARNWGHRIVAHNVRCYLKDEEERMKRWLSGVSELVSTLRGDDRGSGPRPSPDRSWPDSRS
jgi:hypothetical protein